MDEDAVRKQLEQAYLKVLSNPAYQLSPRISDHLSGVFLPTITRSYAESQHRLMIVGQETRGWIGAYGTDLQHCKKSMAAFEKWLSRKPGRSSFLQFHRSASRLLTDGADLRTPVMWGNLFAVSYRKKSPVKSRAFLQIRELSKQLLAAQLELLKPQAIIFTTGWRYDTHLKHHFKGRINESKVLIPLKLWYFKIDNIHCFRTSHPRFVAHNKHRQEALLSLVDLMKTEVTQEIQNQGF